MGHPDPYHPFLGDSMSEYRGWSLRAIGIIPFAHVVQRKQNIYIGMTAHVLFNILNLIPAMIFIFP